jgi:hypothetical protein
MTCVIAQSQSEIPCSSDYLNSKEDCIDYLKQHNNNNPTNKITLIEYTDNDSIVIIIIDIQNIIIKIITNFNTFCQLLFPYFSFISINLLFLALQVSDLVF